jgi:hypothetical protein
MLLICRVDPRVALVETNVLSVCVIILTLESVQEGLELRKIVITPTKCLAVQRHDPGCQGGLGVQSTLCKPKARNRPRIMA